MNGLIVFTNKDEGLRNIAESHFVALEDTNLMDKYCVTEHESKYEWKFESVFDAIMAANYLCNHFEYCHRF